MSLAWRVDHPAASPAIWPTPYLSLWFLYGVTRHADREMLEQIDSGVTDARDLLVQDVAVHPAFRLCVNGARDPSELLCERHDSLLHRVAH